MDLQKRASSAFWWGLASILTCCAPVGVVALFLGYRVKSDADVQNQPTPGLAWAAMALGLLSCTEMTLAMYYGAEKQKARDEKVGVAQERMQGKREAKLLDRTVACDLTTEYLLKIAANYDAVTCPGPMMAVGESFLLSEVEAKVGAQVTKLDVCIVRGARWFVFDAKPKLQCPQQLVAADANDAAEAQARKAIADERHKADTAAYTEQLSKVRAMLVSHTHATKACPTSITQMNMVDRREIPYVDFDTLNAGKRGDDKAWKFMTKDDALTKPSQEIAVFQALRRTWPESVKEKGIIKDDYSFVPGFYTGWLSIVDTASASVICETPFAFENGEKVKYKRRGISKEESRVENALADDLEERFEEEAVGAMTRLTDRRLRLGLKLLE